MTGNVVIVGTGDHARVVDELARAAGHTVIGFLELDSEACRERDWNGSAPLLGALDARTDWQSALGGARFVVAIGDNGARRRGFERCVQLGLEPAALIHPTAVILGGAVVEPGAQVCAMAMVGVDAQIGADAIINSAASVDHDVVVEPHAFIGPGARLAGRVRIGNGAHVGIGAVVREGTMIGAGALVAAGAVVVADVPTGMRFAGVPARPMDSPLVDDLVDDQA